MLSAHLDDLLRVLLVRDGDFVVMHGFVDGLCGLVLFGDGLVECVRRLICSLGRRTPGRDGGECGSMQLSVTANTP